MIFSCKIEGYIGFCLSKKGSVPNMSRNKQNLTLPVKLDAKTLKNFATFDNMQRKKLWKMPVTQGSMLLIGGLICAMLGGLSGPVPFITFAFLFLGAAIIILYFFTFAGYVRQMVKKADSENDGSTFNLSVSDTGMSISTNKKYYNFVWSEMDEVYRANDAMYVYADKGAFIIPQGEDPKTMDAIWERFTEKMDPKRIADIRKNK